MAHFRDAEDVIERAMSKSIKKDSYSGCVLPYTEGGAEKWVGYFEFDPFSPLGQKKILAYEGAEGDIEGKARKALEQRIGEIYAEAEETLKREIEERSRLMKSDLWLLAAPPVGAYYLFSDSSKKKNAEKALRRLAWLRERWKEADLNVERTTFPYDASDKNVRGIVFKASKKFSNEGKADCASIEKYRQTAESIKKRSKNIELPTGLLVYLD